MKQKYWIALFVVLLLLVAFAMPAYAQVDTSGLTKAQEAELTLQAEKMKVVPNRVVPPPPIPTVQAVSAWADAGKSLAVGLGAGAREVGVAVNEFADTRVGRITTYIIIWKLMGKEILAFLIGVFILLVAMPVVWRVTRRIGGQVTEYEEGTFFWIPIRRKKRLKIEIATEEQGWFLFFGLVIQVVLFIVAMKLLPF